MSSTINTLNSYPVFQPNQVLKDSDLNNIRQYLDEQNRLTRSYLVGMGIICGLEVKLQKDSVPTPQNSVSISQGCGITSEGYLIVIQQGRSFRYLKKSVFIPPSDLDMPGSNSLILWELFETDDGSGELLNLSNLSAEDLETLESLVVLLVCDIEDVPRDSCLIDCDDRGLDRGFELRTLLVSKTASSSLLDAESLIRRGYRDDNIPDDTSLSSVFNGWFEVPEPEILRPGYDSNSNTVSLSSIHNYELYIEKYYIIIRNAIESIGEVFPQYESLFHPIYAGIELDPNAFADLKENLMQTLYAIIPADYLPESLLFGDVAPENNEAVAVPYALQYFYDYLLDIITAFQELKGQTFDLMNDCVPSTCRFPKYLLLGEIYTDTEICSPLSIYRHHFAQAPVYNENKKRLKQIKHQYTRLVQMTREFCHLPFYYTPIKITPGKLRQAALAKRSIPYYHNYPELYPYWSYDHCRKGRSDKVAAYFSKHETNFRGHDLVHRIDEADFYQIEGHAGRSLLQAFEQITQYKHDFNLAFDLITLKLETTKEVREESIGQFNFSVDYRDLELSYESIRDNFLGQWNKAIAELDPDNPDPDKDPRQNPWAEKLYSVFFTEESAIEFFEQKFENEIFSKAKTEGYYGFVPHDTNSDEDSTEWKYELFLFDTFNNDPSQGSRSFSDMIAAVRSVEDEEYTFSWDIDRNINIEEQQELIRQEQAQIINVFATCFRIGSSTYSLTQTETETEVDRFLRFAIEVGAEDIYYNKASRNTPILLWDISSYQFDIDNDYSNFTDAHCDLETLFKLLNSSNVEAYAKANPEMASWVNYFEIAALRDTYVHRLDRIQKMHHLSGFASENPGLEHLGGVPKGGTFVLVYTEERADIAEIKTSDNDAFQSVVVSNKRDSLSESSFFPPANIDSPEEPSAAIENRNTIVIGDFCLPYLCCGSSSTLNYVLTEDRPMIDITPKIFCEGRDESTPFILQPSSGGTIKTGAGNGLVFEDSTYKFNPSRITSEISEPTTIEFEYEVNGKIARVEVLVLPTRESELTPISTMPYCIGENTPYLLEVEVSDEGGDFELRIGERVLEDIRPDVNGKLAVFSLSYENIFGSLSENKLVLSLIHSFADTSEQCGSRSEPLTITLLRTPKPDFDQVGTPTIELVPNGTECVISARFVFKNNSEEETRDFSYDWAVGNTSYPGAPINRDDFVLIASYEDGVLNQDGELEIPIQLSAKNVASDNSSNFCESSTNKRFFPFPTLVPDWDFDDSDNIPTENLTIGDRIIKVYILCREIGGTHTIGLSAMQAGGSFEILDAEENLIEGQEYILPGDPANPCDPNLIFNFGDTDDFTPGTLFVIRHKLPNTEPFDRYIVISDQPDPEITNQSEYCESDIASSVPLEANPTGGEFTITLADGRSTTGTSLSLSDQTTLGTLPRDEEFMVSYVIGSPGCEGNATKAIIIRSEPQGLDFAVSQPGPFFEPQSSFQVQISNITPTQPVGSNIDYSYTWYVEINVNGANISQSFTAIVNGNGIPSSPNPLTGRHELNLPGNANFLMVFPFNSSLQESVVNMYLEVSNKDCNNGDPARGEFRYPLLIQGSAAAVDPTDRSVNPESPESNAPSITPESDTPLSSTSLDADINPLLNRRMIGYSEALADLGGSNAALANSKPFKLASLFLTGGAGISEADAVDLYEELFQSLSYSYKRSGEERQKELLSILKIVSASLADRLLRAELSSEKESKLAEIKQEISSLGIKGSMLRASWNEKELKEFLSASELKKVKKMF